MIKKFLANITFLLFPLLFFALVLEIMLRNIPNEYEFKKNYLDSNSNKLKALFLGNSHTVLGINPEFMSIRSYNAAQVSQTLDYDYQILKKYENQFDSLQYLIINIDYSNIYRRLANDINESWRVKFYNMYFDINTSWKPENNFEILNGTIINTAHKFWNHYYWKLPDFSCTDLGYCITYGKNSKQNFIESGETAAKRHRPYNSSNFNLNIESLKQIISICKKKNIKLFILSTPCKTEYKNLLDHKNIFFIDSTINTIVDTNPNVYYFDFKNNSDFTNVDFFDADHLNIKGSKKLTLKIDSAIKKILLRKAE